jgi:peptide chain release factor
MATSRETRLQERMLLMRVREDDIEEIFTRSSGHGGQNVNKTSTAVVLRHRPTGLQVRCEQERSQGRNRTVARELLLDKLEQQLRSRQEAVRAQVAKLRRQQRRRPRAAQDRILRDKAHHAARKRLRHFRGDE